MIRFVSASTSSILALAPGLMFMILTMTACDPAAIGQDPATTTAPAEGNSTPFNGAAPAAWPEPGATSTTPASSGEEEEEGEEEEWEDEGSEGEEETAEWGAPGEAYAQAGGEGEEDGDDGMYSDEDDEEEEDD